MDFTNRHAAPNMTHAFFKRLAALFLALMASNAAAVTGLVIDAHTRAPVSGAIVTIDNQVTYTDANGRFAIGASGVTTVKVRSPGYLRAEATANFNAPVTIALPAFRPRAVYLSAYGVTNAALREAAVKLADETAVNALVIDMKGDRGMTPYRSHAREAIGAAAHVGERPPTLAAFEPIVDDLRRRGLYLIARIVVFKDDPLVLAHPEWAVLDDAGRPWTDRENLHWADPFNTDVWRHNLDVAEEAAKAGFDEIQFDYVRFPDAKGLHFSRPNTREDRTEAIVGFLSAARQRLTRYNVFVAADIFGYVCWNLDDTAIGQQLETLGAPLDYISPMLYPSGFTWGLPGCTNPVADPAQIVRRSLAEAKRRTGLPGVRFRPWLQAFRDYAFDRRDFGAEEVRAQIEAAQAADTDGWMLWNPRNRYDPRQLPR